MIKLDWEEVGLLILFATVAGGLIERGAWWAVGACFLMIGTMVFAGYRRAASQTPQESASE